MPAFFNLMPTSICLPSTLILFPNTVKMLPAVTWKPPLPVAVSSLPDKYMVTLFANHVIMVLPMASHRSLPCKKSHTSYWPSMPCRILHFALQGGVEKLFTRILDNNSFITIRFSKWSTIRSVSFSNLGLTSSGNDLFLLCRSARYDQKDLNDCIIRRNSVICCMDTNLIHDLFSGS